MANQLAAAREQIAGIKRALEAQVKAGVQPAPATSPSWPSGSLGSYFPARSLKKES